MKKKRHLTPDEESLWRTFTEGVKPLDQPQTALPEPPYPDKIKPKKRPIPSRPEEFSKKNSHSKKLQQKKRVIIEAKLDLHGLTRDQAYRRLFQLIDDCQREKITWVLIIMGKGTPERPSVIRQATPEWLDTPPLCDRISYYTPAKPNNGGEGALYLRLKRLVSSHRI